MPLCVGLPDGPCPKRRNDGSVKVGEGDLMLCRDCDQARFKEFCALQGKSVNVKLVSEDVPNVDRNHAKDDPATVKSVSDNVPNGDGIIQGMILLLILFLDRHLPYSW